MKIMKCSIIFLALISIFADQVIATQRGYICLVPRELSQDSINKIQLQTFDIDGSGLLKLRLLKTNNDTVLTEQKVYIEAGTSKHVINFEVPKITDYDARFQISGKFESNEDDYYEIFGEDRVNFKSASTNIIFIQTDKPIYKPGQIAQFRILLVDSSLKPLGGNTQVDIWIEEPSRSRVAQWKNVSLGYGIIQRELQLSEEPILGKWKIVVSSDGMQEWTFFEEKEYVLPKFEVTIKPPSFVLATAESIPVEICGKYTYGKLVKGTMKITAKMDSYSHYDEKFPTITSEEEIEGCYTYDIKSRELDEDLSYSYRRIRVYAEINETGTGVSRSNTIYISRLHTPLNLRFETEYKRYFKPGLPYYGSLKVTHPNDKAAADEPIEICVTIARERRLIEWWATRKVQYCRNYTSDDNGLVSYIIPSQYTDTAGISIEAKSMKYATTQYSTGPRLYQPQTSSYLNPWYSPSGSHIQVQPIRDPLPCDESATIQVLFTTEMKESYKFYYEVISRGKVLVNGDIVPNFGVNVDTSENAHNYVTFKAKEIQLVPPASASNEKTEEKNDEDNCKVMKDARYISFVGSFNVSIDISADESPFFYFLIYYIRNDRETVADSRQFIVKECFNNKVNLKFQDEVKQPGEKTTLTLSSSPNSLCGIKIVDKSITLLDNNEQLTKEKIFEARRRHDRRFFHSRDPCYGKKIQPGLERKLASGYATTPSQQPWSSSTYEDALTAFENSEFLVISDFILFTRPCRNYQHSYDFGGPSTYSSNDVDAYRQESRISAEPIPLSLESRRPAAPEPPAYSATKSAVDVRTFFPETWLFDLIKVGTDGKISQKETLPHTVTEWLGSAVCINADDGIGLSLEPASIKGFQAFFLSFTLPYSVIRGEKLPVIVTVFNYIDKCLPISIQFGQNDGYILLSDSSEVEICVCGEKSASTEFIIQPTVLGTLNLTVSGRNAKNSDVCGDQETATVVARDALSGSLLIEAEGFPYENVTNALFCPKHVEDGIYTQWFLFNLPEDVVKDSARGYLSISGNIMGVTVENLDSLVRLPTGCGEQNMVTFSPIVSVLDYLKATDQLKDSLEKMAKEYLAAGYQRQLKYRHYDGSYSAFGRRDIQGSIWLTAFVVRSFASAEKYIDIDTNIQKSAINWIISKQRSDGSFPEIGSTLSYGIKGQLNSSSTALSAYVLSSLLIAKMENENITRKTLKFISSSGDYVLDPYNAALFAYTFALAEDYVTAAMYVRSALNKAETNGEGTYWRIRGSTSNSVSVEIGAYIVLTLLKLGEPMERSLPIIRAITKTRNSLGGFISTQDTVLALEALSKFAALLNEDPMDLEITISGDLTEKLTFTDDDKLILKKYKVPEVPAKVNFQASGTGCGIVQATVLCNTLTAQKEDFFALEIKASKSGNCKSANINICTRYLPQGKRSNMALVEIKMVSGMVPSKETLEKLLQDRELKLKRYDVENNNVVFYYDELTNEAKCWQFEVNEIVKVGDAKSAIAKVYDYYATEHKEEATYVIEECI